MSGDYDIDEFDDFVKSLMMDLKKCSAQLSYIDIIKVNAKLDIINMDFLKDEKVVLFYLTLGSDLYNIFAENKLPQPETFIKANNLLQKYYTKFKKRKKKKKKERLLIVDKSVEQYDCQLGCCKGKIHPDTHVVELEQRKSTTYTEYMYAYTTQQANGTFAANYKSKTLGTFDTELDAAILVQLCKAHHPKECKRNDKRTLSVLEPERVKKFICDMKKSGRTTQIYRVAVPLPTCFRQMTKKSNSNGSSETRDFNGDTFHSEHEREDDLVETLLA